MAGWSRCSGGVIGTRKSGFAEGYLSRGEPFDHAHRAMTEGTLPGGRLVRGRCICCRVWLVEQSLAERLRLFA